MGGAAAQIQAVSERCRRGARGRRVQVPSTSWSCRVHDARRRRGVDKRMYEQVVGVAARSSWRQQQQPTAANSSQPKAVVYPYAAKTPRPANNVQWDSGRVGQPTAVLRKYPCATLWRVQGRFVALLRGTLLLPAVHVIGWCTLHIRRTLDTGPSVVQSRFWDKSLSLWKSFCWFISRLAA